MSSASAMKRHGGRASFAITKPTTSIPNHVMAEKL
jgi:hypothetical protein